MPIQEGDRILLYVGGRNHYMVEVAPGGKFHTNKGIIYFDNIIGREYGEMGDTHTGTKFVILEPTTEDIIMNLQRKTQIIYPKDVSIILIKTGAIPGMKVIEIGTGSGAMTIALSRAVGRDGMVISYDLREDCIESARKNLKRAKAINNFELNLKNPGEPFKGKDFDIVFLDVPEPWNEIPSVTPCLKGGGRLASLSPTYNQVELTGVSLEENGYVMIECIELLLRKILPRRGKTRPHQLMIGHTAFLTFGRKTELKNL
ncbi:MAG TPA: tRNA (adenine-N1)-methyltransferase [bacterium]